MLETSREVCWSWFELNSAGQRLSLSLSQAGGDLVEPVNITQHELSVFSAHRCSAYAQSYFFHQDDWYSPWLFTQQLNAFVSFDLVEKTHFCYEREWRLHSLTKQPIFQDHIFTLWKWIPICKCKCNSSEWLVSHHAVLWYCVMIFHVGYFKSTSI